jgi:hypothetical protein
VRNIVTDTLDLGTDPKPLAGARLIATVTLIAATAAKDGSTIGISGGNKEAQLPPGIPVRLVRVDLSQILAAGKEGDSLAIIGHTED